MSTWPLYGRGKCLCLHCASHKTTGRSQIQFLAHVGQLRPVWRESASRHKIGILIAESEGQITSIWEYLIIDWMHLDIKYTHTKVIVKHKSNKDREATVFYNLFAYATYFSTTLDKGAFPVMQRRGSWKAKIAKARKIRKRVFLPHLQSILSALIC